MTVRLYEWDKNETGGSWIEVTANKVINILLRAENNLIKIDNNNDMYTDLQLADWIAPSDTLPVGVTTGRVLQTDGWIKSWTMLCFKTTSGDYVTWIYWDDWKLYIDNWTWAFKQIYLKSEVDALFSQLRSELATVAFSGDYDDLLNKPTLWTAAALDAGNLAGNVPVLDANWKLDGSIVPSTWVMNSFTVTDKADLITISNAKKWDIAIVTSENKTYILSSEPYSVLSNWTELLFPTGSVSSVNWFTWAVNLTTGYIAESNNNLYVSSTEKTTWNNKLGSNNVATVALTGSFNDLNNKPTVDSTLSTTSTNAIQNKAVATAINDVVHKTWAETITGIKTFAGGINGNTWSFDWTNAILYSPSSNWYLYVTRWGATPVTMAIKSWASWGTFWTTTNHQFQFRTNDVARMTVQSNSQWGKVELATWSIPDAWDNSGKVPSTSWVQGELSTIKGDITTIQGDITDLQTAVAWWISDAAFWSSWDWDTTHAPSKNAIYDVLGWVETLLANL